MNKLKRLIVGLIMIPVLLTIKIAAILIWVCNLSDVTKQILEKIDKHIK
jgi:hypothetical protein